ncbi:calx-beta domain-containing protein [Chrysochromulina tobinii]|uniref:Calx-beta domain-containing protein n=1 Tax=Chrysochromulina tobinii TaxID=1460289 RepID=A0A0M0JAR4_9EUKA|nr:calx-beta domain-containing protein [Chrysochromulina tobinii]|eukprot:KOO23570.1 calx-beta domain-containing protein [Chrysochromulina sp. CCMP291]
MLPGLLIGLLVGAKGMADWSIQVGGIQDGTYPAGNGIVHDYAGGAFIAGDFSGNVSFGATRLTARGSVAAFVMHVTASGAIDWVIQVDGTDEAKAHAIADDDRGGEFRGQATFGATTLTSRGAADAFVVRVTESGVIEWAASVLATTNSYGYGIATDGVGGAHVTGKFRGLAMFGSTSLSGFDFYDVFVMHVTAYGVIDWAVQAGGTSSDGGYGITTDGVGGALVTGGFRSEATFGPTVLTSEGLSDVFVMHVTALGVIDWAVKAGGKLEGAGFGIALKVYPDTFMVGIARPNNTIQAIAATAGWPTTSIYRVNVPSST